MSNRMLICDYLKKPIFALFVGHIVIVASLNSYFFSTTLLVISVGYLLLHYIAFKKATKNTTIKKLKNHIKLFDIGVTIIYILCISFYLLQKSYYLDTIILVSLYLLMIVLGKKSFEKSLNIYVDIDGENILKKVVYKHDKKKPIAFGIGLSIATPELSDYMDKIFFLIILNFIVCEIYKFYFATKYYTEKNIEYVSVQ